MRCMGAPAGRRGRSWCVWTRLRKGIQAGQRRTCRARALVASTAARAPRAASVKSRCPGTPGSSRAGAWRRGGSTRRHGCGRRGPCAAAPMLARSTWTSSRPVSRVGRTFFPAGFPGAEVGAGAARVRRGAGAGVAGCEGVAPSRRVKRPHLEAAARGVGVPGCEGLQG